MLNLNITYYPAAGPLSFSIYAVNLLDETTFGGDTQLPNSPAFGGGVPPGSRPPPTFSPLNKGRVVGAEFRVKF
jgi:iron complex outermembrane receptor protein